MLKHKSLIFFLITPRLCKKTNLWFRDYTTISSRDWLLRDLFLFWFVLMHLYLRWNPQFSAYTTTRVWSKCNDGRVWLAMSQRVFVPGAVPLVCFFSGSLAMNLRCGWHLRFWQDGVLREVDRLRQVLVVANGWSVQWSAICSYIGGGALTTASWLRGDFVEDLRWLVQIWRTNGLQLFLRFAWWADNAKIMRKNLRLTLYTKRKFTSVNA